MNSQVSYSFGALLVAFRKRKRLTQQQLATAIGVHRNAISRWEQGDFLPESKATVLELARYLALDDPEARQLLEASFTALAPPWLVPYQRNPFFTGRQEILDTLQQRISADRASGLPRSYAFYGLGGVGKTHLAIEYAYRHALEYSAIFWIQAESSEHIITCFQNIAELLKLPERQDVDQQRMVAGLQQWLLHHQDWLLIWDNMEELELLHQFLPSRSQGTILLTTRSQALGTLAQGIQLSLMSQEEGVLLLLRRAKILPPNSSGTQLQQFMEKYPLAYKMGQTLVNTLDALPLALDQAGAYLEETGCSLNDYLHRYKVQGRQLLNRRGTLGAAHPQSVVATLSLAYEQVKQVNPAAAELLCWCAFLHPDAIPEELILMGAPYMGPVLQQAAADPYLLDMTIATLRTFSLVNRDPQTHLLSLHRIVQTVLKDQMDLPTIQQWIERTIQAISAVFPQGREIDTWPLCQRYLAQVEVCAALIQRWKLMSTEAARLLLQAGIYLRERAQFALAEQFLYQARTIYLQLVGSEHPDFATSLHELGEVYVHQGKYEQARPLIQQALHIRENLLDVEPLKIAVSLHNLAVIDWFQGKYEQAKQLSWRSLRIRERQLGPEHALIAENLNILALLYWSQENYQQAEQLHQRTLQIWERCLGVESPEVAVSLSNLARLYADIGRYEEAEPLQVRALHIREHVLGPEHPETTISLNNLARLYIDLERYEEAETLFLHTMRIREQLLGLDHPYVAITLNCLANLYTIQRRYPEAKTLFLRALAIRQQLSPQHPHVAETLDDLARFHLVQQQNSEAFIRFQQALAIREDTLGPEHPKTCATRSSYMKLLERQELAGKTL